MVDSERVATWINLGQTARVIQGLIDERLRKASGLSSIEFELLWRLRAASGRQPRMNEIAGQLLVSKSGITRLVERLEAGGLLVRATPAENRRVVHARLTHKGEAALVRAEAAFAAGFNEAFSSHLTNAEVQAMHRTLRKLLERNGAWTEERCAPELNGIVDQHAG